MVAAPWALANQLSLPICRVQFPFPSVSGTRGSSAVGSLLPASRGRAKGFLWRRELPSATQWVREDRSGIRSLRSQGQKKSVCRAGVSSGEMVTVTLFSRHTDTLSHSLSSGFPVPPRCPKTGLEPLTLGEAARWSPGVPPPLGFQNANWLTGQPVPHHAPWESSEALRYHLGYHLGMGEMSAAWAWGLRTYTSPPPPQSQGARVVTFPYLYVHRNLSLSASLWGEKIT